MYSTTKIIKIFVKYKMPTHSLYLTTSTTTINIPSVLSDAVEYLPLTDNFNNYGTNNTFSLTASDNTNVTISSNNPSVTFKSNAYAISNNVTLQIPISFCFWVYTPMPLIGQLVTSFSIGNGLFTGGSDCFKLEARNVDGTFELLSSIRTPSSIYTLSAYNNGIAANKWMHICYTITSTLFTLYVDGAVRASYTISSPKTYEFKTLSPYKYIFGKAADASASYFNEGSIRHFARFNRVLTQTEIANIMNTTKSYYNTNISSSLKPYNKINLNNVKWNISWREIFGNTEGECRVRVKFVSQSATNFSWSANTGSIRASFSSNYQNYSNGFNLGLIKPEIVSSIKSPLTFYLESDTTDTKGTTMTIPKTNTDLIISILNGNESLMVNVPEYHIWLYFDVEI